MPGLRTALPGACLDEREDLVPRRREEQADLQALPTGDVLGKGTHQLEGYTLEDKGYFGPGELPTFDPEIFDMPHGKVEDVLFEDLKLKLLSNQVSEGSEGDRVLREFAHKVA